MTDRIYQEIFCDACQLVQLKIMDCMDDATLKKESTCDLIHTELEFYFSELDGTLDAEKPSTTFTTELQRLRADPTIDKHNSCARIAVLLHQASSRFNPGKKVLHTTMQTHFSSKSSTEARIDAHKSQFYGFVTKNPAVVNPEFPIPRPTKERGPTSQSVLVGRQCSICRSTIKEKGRVKTLPCFHEVHPECMESLRAAGQESKLKECCSTSLKLMRMYE